MINVAEYQRLIHQGVLPYSEGYKRIQTETAKENLDDYIQGFLEQITKSANINKADLPESYRKLIILNGRLDGYRKKIINMLENLATYELHKNAILLDELNFRNRGLDTEHQKFVKEMDDNINRCRQLYFGMLKICGRSIMELYELFNILNSENIEELLMTCRLLDQITSEVIDAILEFGINQIKCHGLRVQYQFYDNKCTENIKAVLIKNLESFSNSYEEYTKLIKKRNELILKCLILLS